MHGIWTAVCDRDPAAPGFAFADRRCIVSIDDEPAIERLASALPLGGVIAAGTDTAGRRRRTDRGEARTGAPALAGNRDPGDRQAAPARGARRGRCAPAALGGRRRGRHLRDPAAGRRQGGRPLESRRALARAATRASSSAALAAAREVSRSGVVLVEEYVDGPEVTVTGFSAGGHFVPLAVTDRIAAEDELGAAARLRLALELLGGRRRGDPARGRGARDRAKGRRPRGFASAGEGPR